MDPFSSFDLFRRRVDQMFADFDQQMFGADPFESPFLTGSRQQQLQQQQQQTLGHEKSGNLSSNPRDKEEERIIPHSSSGRHLQRSSPDNSDSSNLNTDRSLSTRSAGPLGWGLMNWPSSSTLLPSMKLDIVEEKDKYLIHADVPGFNKEQIQLNVKDGMLTLSGEMSEQKEEQDPERKYHRVERSSGSVYRSIRLPEHVKEEEISATCENGVLKVVLPKDQVVENKKERKIHVA